MKKLLNTRHWFWLAPLVLGAVFIGGGIYMIQQGNDAKDEVRSALVREGIVGAEDSTIPGQLVDTPSEAKAQADIIETHVMKMTGGKTYAQLDREDPLRPTVLNSVTLRTSLNLAVMGFKVSDLVIGLGAFMIALGATFVLFLSPAVYWAAEVAREHSAAEARKTVTTRPATETA